MQRTNSRFHRKYIEEKLNTPNLWPALWYKFLPYLKMFSRKDTVEGNSSNFVQYGGELTNIDTIIMSENHEFSARAYVLIWQTYYNTYQQL